MCEDFGDKVTYTNINEKSGFVAVYAGETEADARKVLAQGRGFTQEPSAHGSDRRVSIEYQRADGVPPNLSGTLGM